MPEYIQQPYYDPAATNTKVLLRGYRAFLYTLEVSNPNPADAHIQLFDAAATADVTLGTTTPTLSFLVPAGAGATQRGAMDKSWENGLEFRKGIVYAVTTTPTGLTAPAAVLNLDATYH